MWIVLAGINAHNNSNIGVCGRCRNDDFASTGNEMLLGVFAGLLVGAPLVVVAMLLAVSYRLKKQDAAAGV